MAATICEPPRGPDTAGRRLPLAAAGHAQGGVEDAAGRGGALRLGRRGRPDPDPGVRDRDGGGHDPGAAEPARLPGAAALLHRGRDQDRAERLALDAMLSAAKYP